MVCLGKDCLGLLAGPGILITLLEVATITLGPDDGFDICNHQNISHCHALECLFNTTNVPLP